MEEIFQTYLTATNDDFNGAAGKLKEMTPSPMNTMLEKETKSDAIKKKQERRKKVVEDVPPTTPGIKEHISSLCSKGQVLLANKKHQRKNYQ